MTFFDARRYAESSIIINHHTRNQVNRQSLKTLTSLRLVIKQPVSFQSIFSFLFTIADKQSLSNSREEKKSSLLSLFRLLLVSFLVLAGKNTS
jgi:hypothetical protein